MLESIFIDVKKGMNLIDRREDLEDIATQNTQNVE
jgi:hypothetical protein